MEWSWHPAE